MNTTENQNETKPADKWAAEKAAHAQGKRIERREGNQEWQPCISPQWFDQCEYRIAPDPAPAGKLTEPHYWMPMSELSNMKAEKERLVAENDSQDLQIFQLNEVITSRDEEIARLTAETAKANAEFERLHQSLSALPDRWRKDQEGAQSLITVSGCAYELEKALKPTPTAEEVEVEVEVERERFNVWYDARCKDSSQHKTVLREAMFDSWQAARAAKEGKA